MARRLKVDRPTRVEVQLPTSVRESVNAQLYSEIEGRVPFGAFSKLIETLLIEWLRTKGVIS